MCYDSKSSALAGTIGLLSAAVAFHINQPVLAVLILTYSLMQVAEFCIWRGLDTESFRWNHWGTALAGISLKLHALVVVGFLLFVRWKRLNRSRRMALLVIFGVSLLVSIATLAEPLPSTTQAGCSKGCRLVWRFDALYPIQAVLMGVAFLIGLPEIALPLGVFYFGALASTSALAYFDPKTTFQTAVSTIWCFFVALFAPLLVGYLWYTASSGK